MLQISNENRSMVTRKWRICPWVILLLMGVGMVACPRAIQVNLEPGSKIGSLAFAVSEGRQPVAGSYFGVWRCDAGSNGERELLWRIDPLDENATVRRVAYGVVPSGFVQSAEPKQLGPGCYSAEAAGTRKAVSAG